MFADVVKASKLNSGQKISLINKLSKMVGDHQAEKSLSTAKANGADSYFYLKHVNAIIITERFLDTDYLTLTLYREKYDTSISHEITRVRLKKAKELLADTDLNINEIAEQTGFSNGNVFIKVFKKWEGITPGRYRELL